MSPAELKEALRSGVIGSDNGARLEHAAADYIELLEIELKEAYMALEILHEDLRGRR